MAKKRQTFAKMTRDRELKEKREAKRQRKADRKAAAARETAWRRRKSVRDDRRARRDDRTTSRLLGVGRAEDDHLIGPALPRISTVRRSRLCEPAASATAALTITSPACAAP